MLGTCANLPIAATAQPFEPVLRPFSVHDLNRDGYLDREEYRALRELRRLRHQRQGRMPPQPAPAFDDVDRNGDRLIGEEELTDALRHKMHRYRHRGWRWRYPIPGE
jgi:hypothetical protein